MIKTILFDGYEGVDNDCVVLRSFQYAGILRLSISLPFHRDAPLIPLSVSQALNLRNAIDDMVAVKMLSNESQNEIESPIEMKSNITDRQRKKIFRQLEDLDYTDFDQGYHSAIIKVIEILGIQEDTTE